MTDSDAIRANIERTRGELGDDVDALADKVRPSSIAHRQTDKIKSGLTSVKESVMGSVEDAKDGGASAVDSAKEAGHTAVAKAKGNPIAVGLVAFGLGLLAASLVPASEREKDLAVTVKEKAEPLVRAAGDAAKESAEHLREPAMNAVTEIKDTATEAVESVKDQAQTSAGEVRDSAEESREHLQN